jgi:hypothetical protein
MVKCLLSIFLLFGLEEIWAARLTDESFMEGDPCVPKRFTQTSSYFGFAEHEALLRLVSENAFHVPVCVEAALEAEKKYHFIPPQRIFLWHMQMPRRAIMHTCSPERARSFLASFTTSMISSLAELPAEHLSEVIPVLQSLPPFFTPAAFSQVNEGFLEGGAEPHQKWINVDITCRAIKEAVELIPKEKKMELAYRLVLFMQRCSLDLLPYYTAVLAADFPNLEENYYPFYCLSRRLKGHDALQDKLLSQLKHYGAPLALAKKLHRAINTRSLTGDAAVEFISGMIAPDSPSAELLALV